MSKLKPINPNLVRRLLKLSDRELRVMMYENGKGTRRSHKNPHLRARAIEKMGIWWENILYRLPFIMMVG